MRAWPEEDKPREKMLRFGPAGLTDAEILALLLVTGDGQCGVLDLARREAA